MITQKDLSGPKQIPLVGNLHQITIDKMHQQLESWAKEYGGVYKIGLGPSKMTVVTKPQIIQSILRARPDQFRRMSKMDTIMQESGVKGVFNAEGEEWKAHRRIVAKGLDVNHQKQFYPVLLNSVERLYKKWEGSAQNKTPYNIQKELMRFTVDVTTALAFGYEMNTLEGDRDEIQGYLEKIFPTIFKRINSPIPLWRYIKTKSDHEFDAAVVVINKVIDQFINATRERLNNNPQLKEKPSNFLEGLLVAAEEEKEITDYEVRGNVMTMLLAGEDTTSHTTAWVIYFLCKYPEIQEKLREEANSVLGENKWMKDYEKHHQLSYTEAVIMEAMRLKPVAPILLFEPLNDIEIEGYEFRKGSKIILETREGAVNAAHFTNPLKFDPDRWVKMKNSKCPVHNIDAFVPFGSGARFCPGKNLALLEMKLLISMLTKNFTIQLVGDEPEEVMAFTMMPSAFNIQLMPV